MASNGPLRDACAWQRRNRRFEGLAPGERILYWSPDQRGRGRQSVYGLPAERDLYPRRYRYRIHCAWILRGRRQCRRDQRGIRGDVAGALCAGSRWGLDVYRLVSDGRIRGRKRPGHRRRRHVIRWRFGYVYRAAHQQVGRGLPGQGDAALCRRAPLSVCRQRRVLPQDRRRYAREHARLCRF